MSEKLLTSEELAEALNVSLRTVKSWQANGVIPVAIREGKMIGFDLPKVKMVLARRAAKNAKPAGSMPDQVLTY